MKPFILIGLILAVHILRAQPPVEVELQSHSNCEEVKPAPSCAIISFKERIHHFDTLQQNDRVMHEFEFTNTGNAPLLIKYAKASCGCDVASFRKEPILPGEKGVIQYRYDSKRVGPFVKTINVGCNGIEKNIVLKVRGVIVPKTTTLEKDQTPEIKKQ